jgi:hypothetical protein
MAAVESRNFANIQRVIRNDGHDYLKNKIADPVATTFEPLAPTTESLSAIAEPETLDLSAKIQDEISSDVLPELIDEPAVSVLEVDHSSVADDPSSFLEFQDVVESLPVEDPSVDLRIVAEPLIADVPTEAPEAPAVVVFSEPVDVPLVDAPVSVPTVSPAVPIFIASLLPLEPVETPEAIQEKVEISPSEAPIYSPVQSPLVYMPNPVKSQLSSHFPSRPFGSLPQPRELGFPPVSNTRDNVLRDVNWHAKLGRAYRSS